MIFIKQTKFLLYVLLCYPIAKIMFVSNRNKKVWLIGENAGECLHDNGYFFFKYCSDLRSEDVYFIVSTNTINYDDFMKKSSKVLHYGTMRHVYYFLTADACFFTHTYRDIAYKFIFSVFRRDILKVFLQHGVLGFGNITNWYTKHLGRLPPDIFVISTHMRKRF